jgi:hypothetical protein
MDPEVYPEPELFKPERFIKDGQLVGTKYSDRGHHSYGFGRRICTYKFQFFFSGVSILVIDHFTKTGPGQHIADRSLFIVFTRIMWAFDIQKARNPATGAEIPVDVNAFSEGFSSHPLPFQTDIRPRGEYVKDIVYAAVEGNNASVAAGTTVATA